ncbi:MAG: thioredoxin-disulfide reductase [Deltaproteobacteria bacterium]|nr:thioredoxin-disulfide reductase [Deltaproteobacteria bacterium]
MADPVHNVIIIGSGPAGWTAAVYTARANLAPVVFEGASPNIPGGQLMWTSEVENFPGFPEGVKGPELMERCKKQAERFGSTIYSENVEKIDFSKRPFELTSESGEVHRARALIIATGANAKLLGIPHEKDLMNQGAGVSACATCDGAFYKGEELVVVGGGDSAIEEALFLTRFATKVTLVHRRDAFRASRIMEDRLKSNPKIALALNAQVCELVTEKKKVGPFEKDWLVGVKLKSTKDGSVTSLKAGGLFVAIGHAPNTSLFTGALEMDDKGYLVTKAKSSRTSIEGVFACGDVQDSHYRQAITAAGSGCMAAIDAERWLGEHSS